MLFAQHTHTTESRSERKETRRKENALCTVLKMTTFSAAHSDSQSIIENTAINRPAAGVDDLIPYRTSISYILYYA